MDKGKILIVDDERDLLFVLESRLKSQGYSVPGYFMEKDLVNIITICMLMVQLTRYLSMFLGL